MDGTSTLAKKITRNLREIKDRVSVVIEVIVDILIENDVVQMGIKHELDARGSPAKKMDYLIHIVISQGEEACEVFLEALNSNKLDDLVDKIRITNIPKREGTFSTLPLTMETGRTLDFEELPSEETTELNMNRVATSLAMEQKKTNHRLDRLEVEKEKVEEKYESLRDDFECHRKETQREKEELIHEKETCSGLERKIKTLAEEFAYFQINSGQTIAEKNRTIERLKHRNSQLNRELEVTKRHLHNKCGQSDEQADKINAMKISIEEKSSALLKMTKCIDRLKKNTNEGKHNRDLLNQTTCHDRPLPAISKNVCIINQPVNTGYTSKKRKETK